MNKVYDKTEFIKYINKEATELSGEKYKEELLSVMDESKRAKYKCPMELLSSYIDHDVLDLRVNKDYQRKTIQLRDGEY